MCKFSIVTVCYNAKQNIEKTLKSVLSQSFMDYEYIVIDGGSDDGTTDVLNRYKKEFVSRGIAVSFISEKDQGIYDAMNKGINISKGEWIVFMNAGDTFYDDNILMAVSELDVKEETVIYADTVREIVCYGTPMYARENAFELSHIKEGMPFCHQSTFTKTTVLKERPFDTDYNIAADYDFFSYAYNEGMCFKYLNRPVAIFENGGTSTSQKKKKLSEFYNIQQKYGFISEKEYKSKLLDLDELKEIKENLLKGFVKKLTPACIIKKRHIKWLTDRGFVDDPGRL